MSKWNKLFGLEHPEAYGEIKKPDDKGKYLFNTDLNAFNNDVLVELCKHFEIDIQPIWRKYGKTKREQCKKHGVKYEP